jgi:hypothetical protein
MAYGDKGGCKGPWRNWHSDEATTATSGKCTSEETSTATSGASSRERSLVDAMFTALAKGHASRQVVAAAVAAVLRTSVSSGSLEPPGAEVAARLDALRPCIAAQVSASAQLGHNFHSCRGLVEPAVKLRGDIARHSGFDGNFAELSEGDMKAMQRASSRAKKAAAGPSSEVAPAGTIIDGALGSAPPSVEDGVEEAPAHVVDEGGGGAARSSSSPVVGFNGNRQGQPAQAWIYIAAVPLLDDDVQRQAASAQAAAVLLQLTQAGTHLMPHAGTVGGLTVDAATETSHGTGEGSAAPDALYAFTMTDVVPHLDVGVGTAKTRFVSKATQCFGASAVEGACPPGRVQEGDLVCDQAAPSSGTANTIIDPFVENDPWASARVRSSPAVAVEESEVGAHLRGEWVACPAGHRLIYMRVDDDYSCNVCANTVSFAFGCRLCEFDVCGNCKLSGDPVRNVHDSMPPGKANGP